MIKTQRNAIMRHKINQSLTERKNIDRSEQHAKQNHHIDRRDRIGLQRMRNNQLNNTARYQHDLLGYQNVLKQHNKQLQRDKSIKSQRNLKKFDPSLTLVPSSMTPSASSNLNLSLTQPRSCSQFLLDEKNSSQRLDGSKTKIHSFNYNYLRQLQNGGSQTSRGTNRKQWQVEHQIQTQHIQNMHTEISHLLKVIHQNKNTSTKKNTSANTYLKINKNPDKSTNLYKDINKDKGSENIIKSSNYLTNEQEQGRQQTENEKLESKISEEWGRCSSGTNFTQKLKPFSYVELTQNNIYDEQIFRDMSHQYHRIKKQTQQNQGFNNNTPVQNSSVNPTNLTKSTRQMYTGQRCITQKSQQTHKRKVIDSDHQQNNLNSCKQSQPYNHKKEKQNKQKLFSADKDWLGEDSSSYIDVIEKQISKIKGKIMDSQRITRQMQSKYLNTKNSIDMAGIICDLQAGQPQRQISAMGDIKMGTSIVKCQKGEAMTEAQFHQRKTVSVSKYLHVQRQMDMQTQRQKLMQRQRQRQRQRERERERERQVSQLYEISECQQNVMMQAFGQCQNKWKYKKHRTQLQQLKSSIVLRIANILANLADFDIEMRQWRQFLKAATDTHSKLNPQQPTLWNNLITSLGSSGYHYTQFQLKQILKITSSQTNPLSKLPTPPSFHQILQNLSTLFLRAQNWWHSHIIGSISQDEVIECDFNFNFLDLNKKGQIYVEDIVCFVNLYAGKFYRNRDFVMMFRRILRSCGKNVDGKFLVVSDLEAVFYDRV